MGRYVQLSALVTIALLNFSSHAAERVFYEDMEYRNYQEHFMERSYTTGYLSYWEGLINGHVTQSTDAYSGNYSMRLDLFGDSPARTIGLDRTYGNTSNFYLESAITGTKVYFRWKQKYAPGADWGNYLSKQLYVNYKDMGGFVIHLVKSSEAGWLLTMFTNDPFEYSFNRWFGSVPVLDGEWHNFELYLDWTGQSNGGDCVRVNNTTLNSTNGTGVLLFRVDGVTALEKTDVCFYADPVAGPAISHVGWPSNRSGEGGSGSQISWFDDLEIWDGLPTSATLANPSPPSWVEE